MRPRPKRPASTLLVAIAIIAALIDLLLPAVQRSREATWWWDEPFFVGGAGGTMLGGNRVLPDSLCATADFRDQWGSAHPGGAQFLFADGGVRAIPFGPPAKVMAALLSPSDGEPTPDF